MNISMKGIKNSELFTIKSEIENLTDEQQIRVLKILIEEKIIFTESGSGTFFNLKKCSKECIIKIREYLKLTKDVKEHEISREKITQNLLEEIETKSKV